MLYFVQSYCTILCFGYAYFAVLFYAHFNSSNLIKTVVKLFLPALGVSAMAPMSRPENLSMQDWRLVRSRGRYTTLVVACDLLNVLNTYTLTLS